ncbi:GntR family transcriptional regulator [Bosea psychrotolerans]|uniref:GntR family transcriptional regulator n=1 Tax=Bosea psychrotolerans TaxID=1871628 RepID=A0A2S4LWY1_9HYPH|nr:GntR family transcriptional regulator [Bosea psychrotolerans]POR46964.1 GntR family transcriptional regulator [Bosea psychrotolerans]
MNEQAIHTILTSVLRGGRLPGGVKLGEHRLAEIFGVSRERIRKVLHRLGHERLLDIVRNRGAFTVEPDLRESHMVYEARRILESGMAAHLADNLTDAQIARLREHVDAEAKALRLGDQATWQRLSAEFHFLLAEMTGNPLVQRQAQELISRTLMLVKRYETTAGSACGCEEHRAIFRALAAQERGKAVKAMTAHLSLVETRLRPTICEEIGPSLEEVLADEIAVFATSQEFAAAS